MTKQDQENLEPQLFHALRLNRQAEHLAKLGFWEWDIIEDRLSYCSEGYARMLDMTGEEVIAASGSSEQDRRFIHPEDRQRYIEEEVEAHANKRGVDTTYRIISAQGHIRHLHEISEVAKDESGQVIRTSGTVQDVTESKRSEEHLAKTLKDARRAERLAKLGTYTWNWEEGKIETCSEEYARLLGMTIEQAITNFSSLEADYAAIHEDDREAFAALEAGSLAKGEGYTTEYRIILPDGGMRYIREICEVELNKSGKVVRSMGSIQDVTEQIELQEQLNQALKIKIMGQLTGGVAHDFNNLLMVVMGNVELAMSLLGKNNPNAELLQEALAATERGAILTRRLLAFARNQALQVQTVDLQSLVLGMKELLQLTLGESIQVRVPATDNQWLSETDITQLETAILNLAINARDAMPDGGVFSIELSNVVLDEDYTAAHDDLNPGPYIQLTVSDTGQGMSTDVLAQVFNPFYTTKEVGQGTGLGLSMVYGFVKQCHGHVSLSSTPDDGTIVRLFLPPNPEGIVKKPVGAIIEFNPGNREQILVVEDDAEVRKLAVRLLHQLGYRTVEAENGGHALQLLRTEPSIALLFSDVVLPGGISGVALAKEAWLTNPDLKVLFTSGYTHESTKHWGTSGYELLEKPYTKAKLAHRLSQVLA